MKQYFWFPPLLCGAMLFQSSCTVKKQHTPNTHLAKSKVHTKPWPFPNTTKTTKKVRRPRKRSASSQINTPRSIPWQRWYPWLSTAPSPRHTLISRFPPPRGYRRISATPTSFAAWLRHLPLLPGRGVIYRHDGTRSPYQDVHKAVVNLNVTPFQQCADVAIRLRAEYLFAMGRKSQIHFKFTSGHHALYTMWARGYRPRLLNKGKRVLWRKTTPPDHSYRGLQRYLRTVFLYAGTYSLSRELRRVPRSQLQIGDLFLRGGFPGHVVIVVDIAQHHKTGKRMFLLAEGETPAESLHIVATPDGQGAWYALDFDKKFEIPGDEFTAKQIHRFRYLNQPYDSPRWRFDPKEEKPAQLRFRVVQRRKK